MPIGALLSVMLRLVFFRQGPQDTPYSPLLTRALVPLAVVAQWLLFVQLTPTLSAGIQATSLILGLVVGVETVLRSRGLANRVSQTLGALLAAVILFDMAIYLPWVELVPVLIKVNADPSLLDKPDALVVPMGAALSFDLLFLWGFAVAAHIMREAADVRPLGGIALAALLVVIALLMMLCSATLSSGLGLH